LRGDNKTKASNNLGPLKREQPETTQNPLNNTLKRKINKVTPPGDYSPPDVVESWKKEPPRYGRPGNQTRPRQTKPDQTGPSRTRQHDQAAHDQAAGPGSRTRNHQHENTKHQTGTINRNNQQEQSTGTQENFVL
jgi:hypothetical protein